MSEPENTSGAAADRVSPIVMVESASSKHTLPFRPVDRQEEGPPDLHQKRAPAVASAVAENLKDTDDDTEIKDLKENLNVKSSEQQHKHVAKKLSSNISSKKRGSPVAIPLMPMPVQSKAGEIIAAVAAPSAQPIPELTPPSPVVGRKKEPIVKKDDEDSITSEIAEERTPEAAAKTPEWSDDEEAGGLPRSESRTSRVARAVRQLLCCGVPLEAPSEDNVSARTGFYNSGI